MNGGMTRATAHSAIAVLAGLLLGTVSGQAADLGGNCCADLEERVAELEATTARKGNRRMSLTISGQVSRSIMYWDDGRGNSDTYAGLENHNQSTRFTFSGSAKIRPDLTAGFEIMTEVGLGGRTSSADQVSPDGNGAGFLASDHLLGVRTANWYLEDKHWGRVTVGRIDVRGPVVTIDLGGISTVANASPSLFGGGFVVAGPITGGATATRMGAVVGPSYGGDRMEGIRWDSSTLHGFVAQAAWGEDDIWSASLRYAGEFHGFRVAAGIGYQEQDPSSFQTIQLDTGLRNMDNEWAGSLAIMHVASGLFAQGHYAQTEFLNGNEGNTWMVQAGITKNWHGLGNTSFYGEYGEAQDQNSGGVACGTTLTIVAPGACDPTAFSPVDTNRSDVTFFGLGVVQQIDAAAMEVFLGWRRFEIDVSPTGASTVVPGSTDLDLVHGGARIRF